MQIKTCNENLYKVHNEESPSGFSDFRSRYKGFGRIIAISSVCNQPPLSIAVELPRDVLGS